MEHVLVSREGHGRSPLPGLRIDRTVGWFTACYPVHLDASRAADTEWTIKTVKESLRQVPSQGTGYGILRFLTRPELKGVLRFQPVPVIEFNYLGRFDEVSEPHGPVRVVGQAPDGLDPEGETGADLILTASLASDLLQVGLDFNSSRIHDSTAESLLHAFDQALSEIVDHCRGRGSREITPSDLTEKGLSMEELSAIDALVAQSE
jgi:non-ribosomal peptide synthase protein (TIGR01720 family)